MRKPLRMRDQRRDLIMAAHREQSRRGNGSSAVYRALEVGETVFMPLDIALSAQHVSSLVWQLARRGYGTYCSKQRLCPVHGTLEGFEVTRVSYGPRDPDPV